jgi:hypothetical protein
MRGADPVASRGRLLDTHCDRAIGLSARPWAQRFDADRGRRRRTDLGIPRRLGV